MLTRIEVDGFKNLIAFSADFGAFTCIAGPNAVGKSNLFDAIEFVSALAEYPLAQAASHVRALPGAQSSSRALFWSDGEGSAERIRIAVEMIAGGLVSDELGRGNHYPNALMRYEVELRYEGGLRLVNERLAFVGGRGASGGTMFPAHPSFVAILGLPDDEEEERVVFDLAAGVMPKGAPAAEPRAMSTTLLSHYRTLEHAEVLVPGETIRSWRRLTLEADLLRMPYRLESQGHERPSALELPHAWQRLCAPWGLGEGRISTEEQTAISAEVVSRLAPIASLREIWLDEDEERGRLTLRARLRSGEEVSARELSDGTLRYLALILLGMMPGTLRCIEEPENGIHPRRFSELAQLLRGLAADLDRDVTQELAELDRYDEIPLRQVIVNTHSSALVREVYEHSPGDLLMATTALSSGPEGRDARALRLHPLRGTWRCGPGVRGVSLPLYSYIPAASLEASAAEEG